MTGSGNIRFSAGTHVGHVRSVNEDSLISLPDQGLWVVSDGMGGHAAGDFASQTVTEAMAVLPNPLPPTALMHAVRNALHGANATIWRESEAQGGATIGATVVALIVTEGHFMAFWAGDSRIYRLRDGEIEMLSTDHSLVAEFVESGEMTWDEAEQHPNSNVVTRAVGVDEVLELDKIRGEIASGDRFLLCSDGLTKYADFRTLRDFLKRLPIETVVDRLIQHALDGGGADNVTAIVVDIP